jgi:hypothetical protein
MLERLLAVSRRNAKELDEDPLPPPAHLHHADEKKARL